MFSLAIHPLVDRSNAHLDSSKSVAINVEMQMTLTFDLTSLGYIPSGRIAGSRGLFLMTWEVTILIS